MKKSLPDFCVSSEANGFDEFLKVYSEYFRYDYQGFNLFYGVKNNDENYDDKAWTTNIITPFEAIALLTAKPLTEGDSAQQESVKREDENKSIHRILIDFGCPPIPFDENVTMYYPAIVSAMQEYSNQQTAHLQQQLDEAKEKIEQLKHKIKVVTEYIYDLEDDYDSGQAIFDIKSILIKLPPTN